MDRHLRPRESGELLLLRSLAWRMDLGAEGFRRLEQLQRGYEGELAFYRFVQEKFNGGGIFLFDFLFEWGGRSFQVDSLLIANNEVRLFEVKNFEGDYFIQDEGWFSLRTKKEIANPLLQLRRSDHLFRGLLSQLASRYSVRSSLAFVNPRFFLYGAPVQLPALFPGQFGRFFDQLNKGAGVVTDFHRELAEKLVACHIEDNPFERVPKYGFDELKKGVPCQECGVFMGRKTRYYLICPFCKSLESNEKAICRLALELILLFPDIDISSSKLYRWCGELFSLNTIRKTLKKHFIYVKKGRSSYFTLKNK